MLRILRLEAPIISIVLLGMIFGKYNLLGVRFVRGISSFVFYMAMPIELFLILSKSELGGLFSIDFIASFAISAVILWIIIATTCKVFFNNTLAELALNLLGAGQVNTAYLAIPLFVLFLGNAAPVIPITIFQVMILTSVVIYLIEYDLRKHKQHKIINKGNVIIKLFRNIFKPFLTNPLMIGSTIGILFSCLTIHLPKDILSACAFIGGSAAPLALFSLGLTLIEKEIILEKKDKIELFILLIFKNILHPFIAFIIGKYIFHLSMKWLIALVLISAMPSPKNLFVFATKYDIAQMKSSILVSVSTLISFIVFTILFVLFETELTTLIF